MEHTAYSHPLPHHRSPGSAAPGAHRKPAHSDATAVAPPPHRYRESCCQGRLGRRSLAPTGAQKAHLVSRPRSCTSRRRVDCAAQWASRRLRSRAPGGFGWWYWCSGPVHSSAVVRCSDGGGCCCRGCCCCCWPWVAWVGARRRMCFVDGVLGDCLEARRVVESRGLVGANKRRIGLVGAGRSQFCGCNQYV